ncbi:MAG: hypothetical protein IK130_00330 [Oscillospiraceae bacterium]|nr:hypothetical protein [Oscillospiraceae bacterium]
MDDKDYTNAQLLQLIVDTVDYDEMPFAIEELVKRSSDAQLVQFIEEMFYYDVIPYALDELMKRSSAKAFDLGMDILIHDKGDQFLQACVWSTCFDFDENQTVALMRQRTITMEWSLMETLLLSMHHYETNAFPPALKKLIMDSYDHMPEEKKAELSEMFRSFLEKH